jgi:hypothetical protein
MELTHALLITSVEWPQSEIFDQIESYFAARNIQSARVRLHARFTTLSQNVDQFSYPYAKYDRRHTVIFGFGLAAMCAFVTASQRPPAALILASLDPWFAEDIPVRSSLDVREASGARLKDFERYRFSDLVKTVSSKTIMLLGDEEAERTPPYFERAKAVIRALPGSELLMVPGVRHDLTHSTYLAAIKQAVCDI